MINYDKLWKNWHKKTSLNEMKDKYRKALLKHMGDTIGQLGSDSPEILSRSAFNYAFNNDYRVIVQLDKNEEVEIAKNINALTIKINEVYKEKQSKGNVTSFYVQFFMQEQKVQQSIEGGRESVEVTIKSPAMSIAYKNKMNQTRQEIIPLGRAFNKYGMKKEFDHWASVQGTVTNSEKKINQILHYVSILPQSDLGHLLRIVKQYETSDYGIVISRNPMDIARMSDFPGISSCHSQGGSYFICALEEAKRGGAVAYLLKSEDIEKIRNNLQNPEIFFDEENIKANLSLNEAEEDDDYETPMDFSDEPRSGQRIVPVARLRIRRVVNLDQQIDYMAPDDSIYGIHYNEFYSKVSEWCASKQAFLFKKEGSFDISSLQSANLVLTGGSYQDSDISVAFDEQIRLIGKQNGAEDTKRKLLRIGWKGVESYEEYMSLCEQQINTITQIVAGSAYTELGIHKCSTTEDKLESAIVKLHLGIPYLRFTNVSPSYINSKMDIISEKLKEIVEPFGNVSLIKTGMPSQWNSSGVETTYVIVTKKITSLEEMSVYQNRDLSFANPTNYELFRSKFVEVCKQLHLIELSLFDSNYVQDVFNNAMQNSTNFIVYKENDDIKFKYTEDGKDYDFSLFSSLNSYIKPQKATFTIPPAIYSRMRINSHLNTFMYAGREKFFIKLKDAVQSDTTLSMNQHRFQGGGFPSYQDELTANSKSRISFDALRYGGLAINFDLKDNKIFMTIEGTVSASTRNSDIENIVKSFEWMNNNPEELKSLVHDSFMEFIKNSTGYTKELESSSKQEVEVVNRDFVGDVIGLTYEQLINVIVGSLARNNPNLINVASFGYSIGFSCRRIDPPASMLPLTVVLGIKRENENYKFTADVPDWKLTPQYEKDFYSRTLPANQLTRENIINAYKDLVPEIEQRANKMNRTILKSEQQITQENVKLKRKLLREKLIKWYRRKNNE